MTAGAASGAVAADWRNRSLLGVSDQLVSSATNFLVAFLAARWLEIDEFGSLVVAMSVVYGTIGLQRAVIGDPLVVHASALPAEDRRRVIGDAASAAFWLGLLASLAAVLLGVTGLPVLRELVWFAPWLPLVLLHEAGRYGSFSEQRPGQALITDVVRAVVQTAGFVVIWLTGSVGIPTIVASWGAGALAACGVYAVLARRSPLAGRARRWFRQSRHLSGWFFPTAVVDQVQNQVVVVLVGALLGLAAAGGLRGVQLLILQPAQTLMVALIALIVPWVTGTSAAGTLRGLHVRVRRLGRYFAAGGGCIVLLCIPFGPPMLQIVFPNLTAFADLILPTALLAMLVIAVVPYDAELRGLREVRHLFVMRAIAASVTLAGVVLGAAVDSLLVIAWTFALSSVVFYCGVRLRCYRVTRTREVHETGRRRGPDRRTEEREPPPRGG